MFFDQLNLKKIKNKIIIVDIDGTLVAENDGFPKASVCKVIDQLKKNNQLYIFSNNKNYKRNIRIAKKINIEYLKTDYHKPSKKIIENLSISNNLIIIGDKILTDGLFARHIGATFIKVERYKSKKDRLITKIIYRLDDLCQYLLS